MIGPGAELASLTEFLDGLADGSAGLMLTGEAGVGKTTLWLAGVDAAHERGYRVGAEAELAFAGIGDLLEDVLASVVEDLPGPQAEALRVALPLDRPRGAPPEVVPSSSVSPASTTSSACDPAPSWPGASGFGRARTCIPCRR